MRLGNSGQFLIVSQVASSVLTLTVPDLYWDERSMMLLICTEPYRGLLGSNVWVSTINSIMSP